MLNLLVRYKIRTNRGSGVTVGNYINVYWDDEEMVFKVYKYSSATTQLGTLMSSGPDLGADRIDFEKVDGIVRPSPGGTDPPGTIYGSRYRYCTGTTLVSFTPISTFPYSKKIDNANHFSCLASTVCDLDISPLYDWDRPSDLLTNDGWLEVFASSSNGPIKYSLDPNFDYNTQGQLSGLFEDLYHGTYTVTAKDAAGCVDQKTISVTVSSTYGVLFRLDYKDVHGVDSRVDILQRGYTGSIVEVVGSDDPFVYQCYSGEDFKFYPIAASEGVLTLMSTINFMFRDLHTQDDRKYQMKWYKNYGSGLALKFFGYLIPQNNKEPYIKDPYPVTFTATDGLADLKNFDFSDKDGNLFKGEDITLMDAITAILAKTDLGINIQCAINRFQATLITDSSSDPLLLYMFNPETFYHGGKVMNCLEVLKELLKPFGAVIKQRLGKWFIFNPEQLVTGTPYREFTADGALSAGGTVSDIVDIDTATMAERAVMEGGGQMLEFIPAYGNFYLEHTLLKHDSLVKGHGFELEDIHTDPNTGLTLFKDWNVNISNSPGATFGIKKTKALEGDYNFFLQFPSSLVNNVADGVSVLSAPFAIEYDAEDAFEYNFSYAALLSPGNYGQVYWVKLKWMLKVGAHYYNENAGWTTDPNQKYNEILVDRFNDRLEKNVSGLFRAVPSLSIDMAQVEFVLTNTYTYDFSDINALKEAATTTKPLGAKMKVRSTSTLMHYYVLEEGTDPESGFDVVRPNDYATTDNERIWVAEHLSVASRGRLLEYWYLDNVVLLHNPDATEPPNTVTVLRKNNSGIKIDFEETYLLNDIDTENINNSERTYKNFFKTLAGAPTGEWRRTYRAGEGKLLDLLSDDVVSQYKTPSMKITGSFFIDTEILPTTILNEVNDSNRKYMFMGYALHDKHQKIDFDIIELKDATDPDGDDIDAGFTTGFSFGFRS